MKEKKAREILSDEALADMSQLAVAISPRMNEMTDALLSVNIAPERAQALQRHLLMLSRDAAQLAVSLYQSIRTG
jgi:hypothetical protein